MKRFILLALAVHASCAASAIADDYLVRLDAIGYVDVPASERDPEEAVLYSIEVVVRPQTPFHAKAQIGPQTLTLSGKISQFENGDFVGQVRYAHSADTGIIIPTEDGRGKPSRSLSSSQTQIMIGLGDSVCIGGNLGRTRHEGKGETVYKVLCFLTLTKYEPTDDSVNSPTE